MDMKEALNRIASNLDLSREEMKDVMRIVMNGEATDAQIGALLMGLRIKSETVDEITGAVEVMRELVSGVTIKAEFISLEDKALTFVAKRRHSIRLDTLIDDPKAVREWAE